MVLPFDGVAGVSQEQAAIQLNYQHSPKWQRFASPSGTSKHLPNGGNFFLAPSTVSYYVPSCILGKEKKVMKNMGY